MNLHLTWPITWDFRADETRHNQEQQDEERVTDLGNLKLNLTLTFRNGEPTTLL